MTDTKNMVTKPTPGPWVVISGAAEGDPDRHAVVTHGVVQYLIATVENGAPGDYLDTEKANAHLIAEAGTVFHETGLSPRALADRVKTLEGALRLHQAWSDSERAGPDYGGQTRDTHPDGERIWKAWWANQLDLCDRATEATRAALKTGEA